MASILLERPSRQVSRPEIHSELASMRSALYARRMEPVKYGDKVIAVHPNGGLRPGTVEGFSGEDVIVNFDYDPSGGSVTANLPLSSVTLQS